MEAVLVRRIHVARGSLGGDAAVTLVAIHPARNTEVRQQVKYDPCRILRGRKILRGFIAWKS